MRYLGILLLSVAATFAHADEASKSQKIDELLTLTNSSNMIDEAYSQMEMMLQNMSDQMGLSPEEQPLFDEYHSRMTLVMHEEMSWEKMKEPMGALYAKHFSEREIDDMLTFYRTETGQKVIEKLPLIMQDSMVLAQEMMNQVQPRLQELVLELQESLAALRKKNQQQPE